MSAAAEPVIPPMLQLHFEQIDSTNAEALRQASALPDRALLSADRQSAGRGRRGRAWQSATGNVCFSLFARCAPPPPLPAGVGIAVGVALAETLAAAGVAGIQLKWPNDLQVAGRKLGGILIEVARFDRDCIEWVIGVGLNLQLPRDAEIDQAWIDLAGLGIAGDARTWVERLAQAVLRAVDGFCDEGLSPVLSRWPAFDALAGREVRVEGGRRAGGVALGLAGDGALRLRDAQGEWCCHAGEVSVRVA